MIVHTFSGTTTCFNSLRTGNRISSREYVIGVDVAEGFVSIPSERETVFQRGLQGFSPQTVTIWFQFPPNGKGLFKCPPTSSNGVNASWFQFPPNGKPHFKTSTRLTQRTATGVSIPSERETAFQGESERDLTKQNIEFQFPPNGKALFK